MSDPVMDRLAALASAAPDRARADRTRIRCRAAMTTRAPKPLAPPARVRRLWQPALVLLGLLYVVEALVVALQVYASG